MDDEFFMGIVFPIEATIHEADRAAAAMGIELRDSHIKSCLAKARTLAKGRRPKAEPATAREKYILDLAETIDMLRSGMRECFDPDAPFEECMPLRVSDWILAIKIIENSIKFHTLPGTRYYLDYLSAFMAEGRSNDPE